MLLVQANEIVAEDTPSAAALSDRVHRTQRVHQAALACCTRTSRLDLQALLKFRRVLTRRLADCIAQALVLLFVF